MDFNRIPVGDNVPDEIHAIIEIPAQSSPVKYEAHKTWGLLRVDRIISTGMRYPYDYGFVPQTLARDGDPLDVIVISPIPLEPLSVITCRPIGLLNMTDQAGPDEKVIAVPTDSVCPATSHLKELHDLSDSVLEQLQFFFERYKELEPGKWVKFEGWGNRDAAKRAILEAAAAFTHHG